MSGCRGCGSKSRPTPYPGPRCGTCHRAVVKARKAAAHEKRVQAVYGLDAGEYERRYAEQGGVCAICLRATGRAKRLSVDHDHRTGRVRGLLCGPCNQLIGRLGADALRRAAEYLEKGGV